MIRPFTYNNTIWEDMKWLLSWVNKIENQESKSVKEVKEEEEKKWGRNKPKKAKHERKKNTEKERK